MGRNVTVVLKAHVGQFKKGMGEAERAAEDLGDALDDVDGKGLDEAAKRAKGLGDEVGKTSRKAKRDLDQVADGARKLDAQIRSTQMSTVALAKAFAASGDPKVLAQMRKQQAALADLREVQKTLDTEVNDRLGKSVRNAMGNMSPAAAGIGVFGASLTPMLGGIVAGAVVGGVGVGGIAGGIALAARSPFVKSAAEDLGRTVMGTLAGEARDAMSQPLLESMARVEKITMRLAPKLGEVFEGFGASMPGLTDDLGAMLDGLLTGMADLASTSGPVMDSLGDLLADLGESLGELMTVLSENPEAAAAALDALNGGLQDAVSAVGAVMSVLLAVGDVIGSVSSATEEWAGHNEFLVGVLEGLENVLAGPVGFLGDLYDGYRATTPEGKRAAETMREQAAAAAVLEDAETQLKTAQEASAAAQLDLNTALDGLNPAGSRAKNTVDGLRTAVDQLFGAQERAADANQSYEASWDGLSASVKDNKRTLDIHTEAGRNNRDALKGLLQSSRDMYLADIEAGKSTAEATKAHQDRTKAVKEEAKRLGLNVSGTKDLIRTYGQIPPTATTQVIADGVKNVADQLFQLTVVQYALAKGIPVQSAEALLKGAKRGPAKGGGNGYGGYATGGQYFSGRLPGAPSSVDNLVGVGPAGDAFGLAGGEYVINARQTKKHLPLLAAINSGMDGYASGGYYPNMVSASTYPFRTTASNAFVMSEAQAKANVVPEGPSGGGATAPWIVATIKRNFPNIDILSVFRKGARTLSGNASYHGANRAVDTEPSEELARYFYTNFKAKLKELITPFQKYNVHNGQSHTYTGAVWNQHNFAGGNAHDHIAMANGGLINEHIFGVGKSGTTYEFGERGTEAVVPLSRGYASGGLVNVAPSTSTTTSTGGGSRLDYLASLLAARDAVASLTASLKENGRTWAVTTAKGRANRQSLISGVRAAQAAAEAKYAETGSVKAANKVYAEYIAKLNASMKAMGVNAKTRKALLRAYGERPQYDVPGAGRSPSNSSARVRSVTDQIAAEEQISTIRQAFAWTKPTFNTKTEAGRSELSTLFGFLGAAEAAAQSLFAEGGNAKASTALYDTYITQLRTVLAKSGMKVADIDKLIKTYGRITLVKNAAGGVYERASGGLREAQIARGGPTMYAWAEQETGGEAFIPRNGGARSLAVWQQVGQQWFGQSPGGRSGPITVHATIPITLGAETIVRQVRLEVDSAVGRVVDAVVYQTA